MNATYIWVNSNGIFQEKHFVFDKNNYNLFPDWKVHDKFILVPIITVKDPFNRDENHRLIYCDLYHIINGERFLDDANKRDDFMTFINFKDKCEIIQTYELYIDTITQDKIISIQNPVYEKLREYCSYTGMYISSCEDSYSLICYNNVYETVWISRYILHRLVIIANLTLYFTELALVNTEIDLNTLFNDMNISNNINTLFDEMNI